MMLSWAVICCSKTWAGWDVSQRSALESHGLPAQVVLLWFPGQEAEHATLGSALQVVADDGKLDQLKLLSVSRLVLDDTFQKEIFQQLETIAPKELGEAMKSAGNMHNPKMNALRSGFEKAVLATPTVMQFKEDLARHQLEVTGVSFEKLSLASSGDARRFSCTMWLVLGRTPDKTPGS